MCSEPVPGGYSAAFYAADQGYKVTLVDASDKLGGVCLHRGCVPIKSPSSCFRVDDKKYDRQKDFGIGINSPHIDLKILNEWKEGIVSKFSDGLGQLCKQRGINYVTGRGVFVNSNTIKISGSQSIVFDRCVIATGSTTCYS